MTSLNQDMALKLFKNFINLEFYQNSKFLLFKYIFGRKFTLNRENNINLVSKVLKINLNKSNQYSNITLCILSITLFNLLAVKKVFLYYMVF